MKRYISNMKELEKALLPNMKEMVGIMATKVYETLNYFLQEYYNSYQPSSYRRQYDFLRSAIKVDPKIVGSKVIASVYIDTDSMDNYYNATGHQVATWANQGLHGGLNVGTNTPKVWDNTMEETVKNGELLKSAIQYLKKKGYDVKE